MDAIQIDSARQLLVDDALTEQLRGEAELRLHRPMPREVALHADAPWEGNGSGYITVFRDGDICRMYYKAWQLQIDGEKLGEPHPLFVGYAESPDGIHWSKPNLGLYEFDGSKDNNIVCVGAGEEQKGCHGFAPFKDENPDCPPEMRYKAVGAERRACRSGLYALVSEDAIHWRLLQEEPIITEGAFDSQNLVFWDSVRGEYRAYVRDFRDGRRCIRTAVSPDFVQWTEPEWLEYPGAPDEQLYTNQVMPYFRAPHIFVGFPTRYVERQWNMQVECLPEVDHRRMRSGVNQRYGTAVTDGLFMSSRDGRTFRRWGEAFIRPGPQLQGNWCYGDNYQCWGMIETESALEGAPNELSFYATEGFWRGTSAAFRRYTLRVDGFVSVNAPLSGGELLTKPLVFGGENLSLNFATSAAGSIQVDMQEADGSPIDGFQPENCPGLTGDYLDFRVPCANENVLKQVAGRPVRLRFVLRDADLYSFQFRQG